MALCQASQHISWSWHHPLHELAHHLHVQPPEGVSKEFPRPRVKRPCNHPEGKVGLATLRESPSNSRGLAILAKCHRGKKFSSGKACWHSNIFDKDMGWHNYVQYSFKLKVYTYTKNEVGACSTRSLSIRYWCLSGCRDVLDTFFLLYGTVGAGGGCARDKRGKNLRGNLDKIQKNSSFPEDTFSILTELQISFECKCSVIASQLFQCTQWTLSKNCAIVMLCWYILHKRSYICFFLSSRNASGQSFFA